MNDSELGQLTLVEPPASKAGGETSQDKGSEFELFWQVYPRRVGKKGALASWRRALKVKEVTADRLIDAARRYAAARQGEDPTYTAHPSTWLNQGRWDDEPVPVRNGVVAGGDAPGEPVVSVSVFRGGQVLVPARWFLVGKRIPGDWCAERDPFERVPSSELPEWHWRRFSQQ